MASARRVYLYLVAAVSLAVAGAGLAILLGAAFRWIVDLGAARSFSSVRAGELALPVALLLVMGPTWAIHLGLAQRRIRRANEAGAADERNARSRAIYLALAILLPLPFWILAAQDAVSRLVDRLLGASDFQNFALFGFGDIEVTAGIGLAAAVVILVHVRLHVRDERTGSLSNRGAWIPRIGLYAGALAGVVLVLNGLGQLVSFAQTFVDSQVGLEYLVPYRNEVAANAAAAIVVGLITWLVAWWTTTRRLRASDARADGERYSHVRAAYFVAIVAWTALAIAQSIATTVSVLLLPLVTSGADSQSFPSAFGPIRWQDVAFGLGQAVPPLVVLWLHRRRYVSEGTAATRADERRPRRRAVALGVAAAGLLVGGVGLAAATSTALDLVANPDVTGSGFSSFVRVQLAAYLGLVAGGLLVWLPAWFALTRRRRADPQSEVSSEARRTYLYLVLGASVIPATIALTIVAYILLLDLLDSSPGAPFVGEMAQPLGFALGALLILVYHAAVLRLDLDMSARGPGEPSLPEPVLQPGVEPSAAPEPAPDAEPSPGGDPPPDAQSSPGTGPDSSAT